MANSDFGGDFSDAHGVADAGAEFIVAREFDLSFIQVQNTFYITNLNYNHLTFILKFRENGIFLQIFFLVYINI